MRFLAFLMIATFPAAAQDLTAEITFPDPDMARIELGRLLFYDPILSGNREVSCGSCHHPTLGTGDGVSLGLGDGARGLGQERRVLAENPPEQRIPRNAPALFNLGAKIDGQPVFARMFHDGRLELDPSRPSGLRTPLEDEMTLGFDSPLAAQAMFPVLSGDEMAGHYSENDIAEAVRLGRITGPDGAWDRIAGRITAIPEYRTRFDEVLGPETKITFTHIANMMADFIAFEWRADASAYDRWLREGVALTETAERGRQLFYGAAGCASCHSGLFQTDHDFHAIAMPQLGPGKAARFERHHRDIGRGRVTGEDADFYRFRTPSLRNVSLTAPYGHAGSYATLEAVVRHHLDPVEHLRSYDTSQAMLPELAGAEDFIIASDAAERAAIASANELEPRSLSDEQVADLLGFLEALTDKTQRLGVPDDVPSGLPVER